MSIAPIGNFQMTPFAGNPVQSLGRLAITALAINALSNIPTAEAFSFAEAGSKLAGFGIEGLKIAIKSKGSAILCTPLMASPIAYNGCVAAIYTAFGQAEEAHQNKGQTPEQPVEPNQGQTPQQPIEPKP